MLREVNIVTGSHRKVKKKTVVHRILIVDVNFVAVDYLSFSLQSSIVTKIFVVVM